MSFEWKEYRLEEIAVSKRGLIDGPFGSNLPASDYSESGIPVIRGSNLSINGRRFQDDSFIYVSETTAKRLERSLCYPGDIIFTKKGTLGQIGIIPENARFSKYLLSSNQMKLTVNEEIANNKFIYLFLSAKEQIEKIQRESEYTGVPKINLSYLKNFSISLPSLPTQRRIAAILTALDDKIELNRRMNETLEGIAQAVWEEWFGKYASREEELPEGWRWGNVLEIAKLIGGGTPKTEVEEYWNGDIPWISGKDITPNNGSIIIETEKKITREGLQTSSAKLLPALSTVISARGTVGNFCLISSEMTISQSNYALKSIIENADFFLFQQVANLVSEMQQKSYGTIFDTITTKTFSEIETPIPHASKMIEYNEAMKPVFEKRIKNLQQSRILTVIRDALLPRLMRGEINV